MIDTLMALWNRGYGCRIMGVALACFLICMSISLLLVTASSPWLPLFSHEDSTSNSKSVVGAARVTATGQIRPSEQAVKGNQARPESTKPTASSTANPCSFTPTTSEGVVVDENGDGKNFSSNPARTVSHSPSSSPTPEYPVHGTATAKPTAAPSPVVLPTTTVAASPTSIATVSLSATPTDTSTPIATETVVITPTDTASPTFTPGLTPTDTARGTPDVNRVSRSGGGPINSGTPMVPSSSGTNDQQSGNNQNGSAFPCLGDGMAFTADPDLLGSVEGALWMIVGSSIMGTLLFLGVICCACLVSRKRGIKKIKTEK